MWLGRSWEAHVTRVICVAGRRRLAAEIWGSPAGTPVFLLHGTPGSRNGPRPRSSVLYRLGVRLISYDRPGYGKSTPLPGRTVADAAGDIASIADELGLESFSVVGRSGGGPHALACAALLGDRVKKAACLVGLAPSNAADLDWYAGMNESNTREFRSSAQPAPPGGQAAAEPPVRPLEIRAHLAAQAQRIRVDPEHLLSLLGPELTATDRRIVSDTGIKSLLTDTYAEAVRQGAEGWIDDIIAFRSPWQFDLAAIKVPVLLWHGADDGFSPVAHTRWLARQVADSLVRVEPDASHFSAIEILPTVLSWIKDPGS